MLERKLSATKCFTSNTIRLYEVPLGTKTWRTPKAISELTYTVCRELEDTGTTQQIRCKGFRRKKKKISPLSHSHQQRVKRVSVGIIRFVVRATSAALNATMKEHTSRTKARRNYLG